MSNLKFIEGFDHWASTVDGAGKGWAFSYFDGGALTLATGRFGGQALDGGGQPIRAFKALPSPQPALFLGAAFSTDGLLYTSSPATSENGALLAVSANGTRQLTLGYFEGTLSVVDSGGAVTAVPGYTALAPNTWTYLELGVTLGSPGAVVVRQDAATLGTFAVPTQGAGVAGYDAAFFYTPDTNSSHGYTDDIYLSNGQGIDAGFCGPLKVTTVFPTDDIATGSWTPNSGTSLYTQVSEAREDGATTTISSSTNRDAAAFHFTSLSGTLGDIIGVQPVICAVGAGSSVAAQVSSGGTLHTAPFTSLAGTAYATMAPECLELDPGTGQRWTLAGFNAATKGIIKGAP